MRCKVTLLLVSLLLLPLTSWAQSHKLLILGDSLSAAYGLKQEQGWVTLLQNAWKTKNIEVIDGAISGDTTDGGLGRLPALLEQTQPSHLLIELGGNDGLQGYPVAKMKTNLGKMIEMAKSQNIVVILQKMRIPTNYGRRYTQQFEKAYDELAAEYAVGLIPFLLEDIALNPELMQRDGIHPKAEAQPQISEYMQQQLSGYFE
ncbi:arylesterase [Alteromonadaceae bacterium BrNp21-10]|nr:arylesterase [Alteromonadaceae bacterium BrNp21-10]